MLCARLQAGGWVLHLLYILPLTGEMNTSWVVIVQKNTSVSLAAYSTTIHRPTLLGGIVSCYDIVCNRGQSDSYARLLGFHKKHGLLVEFAAVLSYIAVKQAILENTITLSLHIGPRIFFDIGLNIRMIFMNQLIKTCTKHSPLPDDFVEITGQRVFRAFICCCV